MTTTIEITGTAEEMRAIASKLYAAASALLDEFERTGDRATHLASGAAGALANRCREEAERLEPSNPEMDATFDAMFEAI